MKSYLSFMLILGIHLGKSYAVRLNNYKSIDLKKKPLSLKFSVVRIFIIQQELSTLIYDG